MRHQLLKLSKGHSTKSERRFAELCKKNHIPFKTKVKIGKYEVDFVIKKTIIEIDSHLQDPYRNKFLLEAGYNLVHIPNSQVLKSHTEEWLRKI
jgi:very-short-patch-repair endonuclease